MKKIFDDSDIDYDDMNEDPGDKKIKAIVLSFIKNLAIYALKYLNFKQNFK